MRVSMCGSLALVWGAFALLACGSEQGAGGGPNAWEDPGESVGGLNRSPVIESVRLLPAEPAPGDVVQAVVRASDADGDKVGLSFEWSVEGRARPESAGELALTGVGPGSFVEVKVTASDGQEHRSESARVRVRNRRPVITGLGLEPSGTVPRGETLRARAAARDPDGDDVEVRFEWRVNGRLAEGQGDSLSTAALVPGDEVQVRALAGDGEHDGLALESSVVRVVNGAPVIRSQPSGLSADGIFRYRLDVVDPDDDGPLRFTLRRGPEGMEIDRVAGELSWRPGAAQAGRHPVVIAVEDTRGARSVQEFELDVGVEGQVPAAPAR
jgi:hypothetical protein